MDEEAGMSEFTAGQRWSFCQHYPNGYTEPFECAECAKIPKMTYTVIGVTENAIQIVSNGKPVTNEGASE